MKKNIAVVVIITVSTLFLTFTYAAASPPGLQKKGSDDFPQGLEKKMDETPKGWNKGNKKGWYKDQIIKNQKNKKIKKIK